MKYLVVTLLSGFLLYSSTWETDLEKAKQKAQDAGNNANS
jgi:hypothetical protein